MAYGVQVEKQYIREMEENTGENCNKANVQYNPYTFERWYI